MNAMKVCNSPGNSPSGACNQVECCTAMCNLNGAGCFCGRGDGIEKLFWGPSSLPISGNMVKLIGALNNTSCPLGTVFSRGLNNCPKGNWESAVGSNTAQCKTSTPSPESDACSTKLSTQRSANLLQMLRLINVANGTAPSLSVATASLKKIFNAKGQMMNRLSAIKTGPESVANNIIKPKLKLLTGSTAVQSSIKLQMSKLSTSGRSISTTFTIKVNDLYGVSHTFGPFNAFAVFSNCSSSIESLYVSNILTSFNTKTLVTPVFQKKPAPTTAPTTRKLLQTPSSISQSTLNTWFLQTVNYIYQLPAVQAITFQFTSGCAESTIGNMQFCSAASITGVLDLDTLGALTTVCGEILCADGAWDTIADWTCSAGCAAACAGCEACDEILLGICGSCSDVCGQTCSCNAECAVSCEESLGSIAVDYTIGDAYFKGLQTLDFTEIQSEGSSYTTGTSTNTTQITDGKPTGLIVTTPISNLQYSLNAGGSFDGFSTSIVFSASSSPNPYNVPALSGSIPISEPTTVINVPSSNWTLSHACTMDYVTTVSYPAGTVTGQNVSNIQGSGALTISLANITIVGDWYVVYANNTSY